jgi:type II secretory pathway pseudopilin PulG
MGVVILVLSILLAVAIFVIWNLNNKVIRQEDVIEYQVGYLRRISDIIVESNLYLDKIDEKGHFRADDELGTFFNFMKEIQSDINTFRLPDDYGKTKK